jgi:hypothetical protein
MQHAQTLPNYTPVANLGTDARSTFIWRTYGHVAAAILGFGAVETYIFDQGWAEPLAAAMLGTSWLLVLGAFMVVGWLATDRTVYAAHGNCWPMQSIQVVMLLSKLQVGRCQVILSMSWQTT